MINLTDRPAAVPETGPGAAAATTSDRAPGAGAAGTSITLPAPAKPAPASINGVNVPSGATVVEDPELLRQILDANRRR